MNPEDCLPEELKRPETTIAKIAAGMSGAGVYRVEAPGRAFVLKIASPDGSLEAWKARTRILRLASDAGVAPPLVHVDEERRAVVTAFVGDRPFGALYANPQTRGEALVLLGRTLRRVHDLPVPAATEVEKGDLTRDPRATLRTLWSGSGASGKLPLFVGQVVERVLGEEPPDAGRDDVLSHNDVNPTNVACDGGRVVLLDWDTAGRNDPFYDLAAAAVFFRMDDGTCARLLEAHDGVAVGSLPVRFVYDRRFIAALCGSMMIHLALQRGHGVVATHQTLEESPDLVEVYGRMRAGALDPGSPAGQWTFGLALVKASIAL